MIPGKLTIGDVELNADDCLANDVIFSDEYNPNRVRPWLIGNEYGALCLVWESCEQDAFDAACDPIRRGSSARTRRAGHQGCRRRLGLSRKLFEPADRKGASMTTRQCERCAKPSPSGTRRMRCNTCKRLVCTRCRITVGAANRVRCHDES